MIKDQASMLSALREPSPTGERAVERIRQAIVQYEEEREELLEKVAEREKAIKAATSLLKELELGDELDWKHLRRALVNHRGNVSEAARALDVDRMTLKRWLNQLEMDPNNFRDSPHREVQKPTSKELIRVLRQKDGNLNRVMEELGVSRMTVYRWMERDGIDANQFRSRKSKT